MLFRTLTHLWFRRAVWFLVGAAVVVLITFVPSGFPAFAPAMLENDYPVRMPRTAHHEYRIEPMEVFLPAKPTWSFDRYKMNLKLYVTNLLGDNLWIQSPNIRMGNPERVIDTPEGKTTIYLPVARIYGVPERYKILDVIKGTWWISFRFFTQAVLLGTVAGTFLGILSLRLRAVRRLTTTGALIATAVPDFLAFVFIWGTSRWLTKHVGITLYVYNPNIEGIWNLPFLVLALFPAAYMARLAYSILKEIETEDYVRTAIAKGLTQWRVLLGHMMRNALPRLLNGLPLLLNISMSALIILEWRFNLYGLAWHLVKLKELEMVATLGVAMALWAIAMDGVIQTIRFIIHPRLREVGE